MKLVNEFTVHASLGEAWPVLLDIPRVAGCIPGATVESSDGDRYRGTVTAKIGPITATYSGTAHIRETDVDEHVMVLALDARESKGQGLASAVVSCRLTAVGDETRVLVETDLKMSGAHAQFGRGVLQSVTGSIMKQFARNLEAEIARGPQAERVAGSPSIRPPDAAPAGEPLNIVNLLPSVTNPKSVVILVAGGLGLAVWVCSRLRRRRRGFVLKIDFRA